MNTVISLSLVQLDLLPSAPHPSPAEILPAAGFMSFPRGELHRWAVCRRAAEIWGMDHESGVGFPPSGPPASWGEIHRSSFDLSYAICQGVSIMREDQRSGVFTSDRYAFHLIPCLQIRPTENHTGSRWGGPAVPFRSHGSFIILLTSIPSHTYRSIHRAVAVFLYPKP